jgi:hypothetical protein
MKGITFNVIMDFRLKGIKLHVVGMVASKITDTNVDTFDGTSN